MKEFERKQLLERIDREGATVGVQIPDSVEVQSETVDLRSFVFEIRRRETVQPAEQERVEAARRNLRRERRERREQLETGDITVEEGERLASVIIGLDRALTELENLDSGSIEAEAEAKVAADRKRWLQFLQKATGQADSTQGRGR